MTIIDKTVLRITPEALVTDRSPILKNVLKAFKEDFKEAGIDYWEVTLEGNIAVGDSGISATLTFGKKPADQ